MAARIGTKRTASCGEDSDSDSSVYSDLEREQEDESSSSSDVEEPVSDSDADLIPSHKDTVSDDRIVVEQSRKRKMDLGSYVSAKVLNYDEYDIFGIIVAAKLRKMDGKQRMYAEKLISEVISKGMLNQLTTQSMIINTSMAHRNNQSSINP